MSGASPRPGLPLRTRPDVPATRLLMAICGLAIQPQTLTDLQYSTKG